MNRQEIFSIVDHTLLKQTATFEQIICALSLTRA